VRGEDPRVKEILISISPRYFSRKGSAGESIGCFSREGGESAGGRDASIGFSGSLGFLLA